MVKGRLFPNAEKARKRLAIMEKRGMIVRLGLVYPNHHPEILWARERLPLTMWQHEAEVTEDILAIMPVKAARRHETEYLADATFWIMQDKELHKYHLENDRGTMRPPEISVRMKRYEGCTREVLWVCPTRGRIESLIHLSATSEVKFWFAVYRDLLARGRECVWVDKQGRKSTLK